MQITKIICLCGALTLTFLADSVFGQSSTPLPIVVQAATPMPAAASAANPPPPAPSESLQSAIKLLQQVKAANAETLKKQEATLQQLDELKKAADELKIYSKRG